MPWASLAIRRLAGKAADELHRIADLLEKIEVSEMGGAHAEMASITSSLTAIRRSLERAVKRGRMTAAERAQISAGFTSIGKSLRGE